MNEYNPGTMCQRLEYAATGQSFGDLCIALEGNGFVDLLLPEHVTPTTKERLMQRRAEVDDVYTFLSTSDGIIITFDLIEAWYDNVTGLYVNRLPPADVLLTDHKRFEMRILEVHETLLARADDECTNRDGGKQDSLECFAHTSRDDLLRNGLCYGE